ncbi:MAG: carboxyl transferase domain-containing protein [Alphaproteobacteria bacterium]|jgi:acetyl-CoA carboxylase carboxyltransferase component|nr:carboxyl transferase domain-containing protein [Alphaproteobacteria bacterium]
MSWLPETEELEQRQRWAEAQGGEEVVARHHQRGYLTVRERIDALLDDASFKEVGKLTGTGDYAENGDLLGTKPAPYVMGLGRINDRPVAIGGEDFTVRGGTSWGARRRKGGQGGFIEDLAHNHRIPLVNLVDGAGGTVNSIENRGYSVFPGIFGFERSVELLGEVPVATAALGTAAGGPAGRAILSHFSVMVKGKGAVFASGPSVVERALGEKVDIQELGGAEIAVESSGAVHNLADSEQECFQQIRRFLSFMPQNVWELPPATKTDDPVERREDELLSIVPRRRTRPYDMRRLVDLVIDRDSGFEIRPTYGKAVITMLARLDGRPVGLVANNPMFYGGAMDAKSSRKQVHFVELCDTFHIPIVFLVDVPGFMVGVKAEREGALVEGMRAVYAAAQLTVPTLTLVIRKCYGMAGMAACNKNGLDYKVAWPSAEWGSLPLEGGVAVGFRREIQNAADPAAREKEIEAELRRYTSPFRTAEAFEVEDIIDPRETRPSLCDFVELARNRLKSSVGQRLKAGVRP